MRARKAWPYLLMAAVAAWVYREILSGQVLVTRDLFRLFIPDAAYLKASLLRGELPLWNPLLRLGQPFIGAIQSQALYPLHVLCVLLFPPARATSVQELLQVALSGGFAVGLARSFGLRRIPSALVGMCWAGGGLFIGLSSQINVASAACWAPACWWAGRSLTRENRARGIARVALPLGMCLFAGSPETFAWTAALTGLSLRRFRRTADVLAMGGALALGIGLGAAVLLPGIEFVSQADRGHGALTAIDAWAFTPVELLQLFLPFAGPSTLSADSYWNQQHFLLAIYCGSVCCALACLGLRSLWRRAPGLALGFGACLAIALGALPNSSLMRYPAKFLPPVILALCLSAGLGLDRLPALARRPGFRRWAGLGCLAALLVAVPILQPGVRSLGVAWFGISVALVSLIVVRLGARAPRQMTTALLLLAAADLGAYQWMSQVNLLVDLESQESSPLAGRVGAGRVSALMSKEEVWMWEQGLFEGPGGRRPFDPRGRSLAAEARSDWVPNAPIEDGASTVEGATPDNHRVSLLTADPVPESVYRLLGVTLFVRRDGPPFPGLEEVPTGRDTIVAYRARSPQPRVWVVPSGAGVEVLEEDRALPRVRSEGFDPNRQLTLDRPLPEAPAGPPGRGDVRLIRAAAQEVDIDADLVSDGYLVMNDACYPGWEAASDGVPLPIACADVALRAVRLGPGSHRVVFRYRPWTWRVGSTITLFCALATLALLMAGKVRRKTSQTNVAGEVYG